jgi:phosphatidylserine/phosphatidylglycerophosphate/cardiolipin synthase-like enzyme
LLVLLVVWAQRAMQPRRSAPSSIPAPTAAPAPVPPPTDAQPTAAPEAPVTVLFAPADPAASGGIDDHLIALIGGARQSVLCAFYDLELKSVAETLVRKHRQGVRVAVVTDTAHGDRPALTLCQRAGIPVVFDQRSAFMHNKFCIVDGAFVWTGSTNITTNCMFRNNNNALLFRSPELAGRYREEFDEMFARHVFGEGARSAASAPVIIAGGTVESWFAPDDQVEGRVVALVGQARQRIEFMAFAFTSVPVARAMAGRMRDNVRVRGLFERRNAGDAACRDDFLRSEGAAVRLDDNPASMHHKVIIIDGETTVTGSYNFSRNANSRNDENLLILRNPRISQAFSEEFERLFAAGS